MSDWASLYSYMAIYGDFYLYADIVPVLCFCTVRLYHAVLFLVCALQSFQVYAYLLEWYSNIKAACISVGFFSFPTVKTINIL